MKEMSRGEILFMFAATWILIVVLFLVEKGIIRLI